MAVNPKSMSGQDTLSMHFRVFTEWIPPTRSLREMSGDSDLLVHPVHVRYRIKQILLYPYHSYIRYRSIPKPSVFKVIHYVDKNSTNAIQRQSSTTVLGSYR